MAIISIPRLFGGTIAFNETPLASPPPLVVPTPFFSGLYTGTGNYPLTKPFVSYAMNGVPLETQPYIATAPMQVAGHILPQGNTFFLMFANPSSATQGALANGVQGTFTFALVGNMLITGPVRISSVLTGTILTVTGTTLADISFSSS